MVKRGSTQQRIAGESAEPRRPVEEGLRVTRLPGDEGLAVAGEVDPATHRDWQNALTSLLVSGVPARLDLSRLSFVDAHGAAVLMSVARKVAPGRTLTLYQPPPCLLRLLDLFWPEDQVEIVIVDEEAG